MKSKAPANQAGEQPGNSPSVVLARMDELIERRTAINKRIADIRNEIGASYAERQQFKTTEYDLQSRLRGLPKKDELYAKLTAKLEQVELDGVRNEEHHKKLDEEITRLETIDLPACTISVCAEDVEEHHRQIKQALAVVQGIRALIDAQNQLILKAQAAIPTATSRQQERYNLLADIAMGNAGEKDLKDLDVVIAKEQRAVSIAEKEAEPQIDKAKATVSGLQRKLEDANEALQALESKSPEVAHRYFMGEAEKTAALYVNHAMRMKELYLRLKALNMVTLPYDRSGFIIGVGGEIKIPLFKLPQFDVFGNFRMGDYLLLDGQKISSDQVAQAAKTEQLMFDAILTDT